MTRILMLISILYYNILPAQTIDELKENSEISWLKTPLTDHRFNPMIGEPDNQIYRDEMTILKLTDIREGQNKNYMMTLAECIYKAAESGNLKVYADKACTEIISPEAFKKIEFVDSVFVFNEKTMDEDLKIIRTPLEAGMISEYFTYSALYYNERTNRFGSNVYAIGLGGNSKIFFWIPVTTLSEPIDYTVQDIVWACRYSVSSFNSVKLDDGEDLKGDGMTMRNKLAEYVIANPDLDLYDYRLMPLDPKYRATLFMPVKDTVMNVDSAGTEKYTTRDIPFFIEGIDRLKILEDWAWDNTNFVLYYKPIAYCPLMKRYDDNGTIRFYMPYFYIKD